MHDDIEKSVLGCCLIDQDTALAISEHVKPEMFTPKHQRIYEAVLRRLNAGEPTDPRLVAETLGPKLQGIGGVSYLLELMRYPATTTSAEHYARELRTRWAKRQLKALAEKIEAEADSAEVSDLLEAVESDLFAIAYSAGSTVEPLGDVVFTHWEEAYNQRGEGGLPGISTGFIDLDSALGGLRAGDLVVLAGRPRMGKTALALNITVAAAKASRRALFFSLEMSRSQIADRLVCMEVPLDSYAVRNKRIGESNWDAALETASRLAGLPVWIGDKPAITTLEVRTKARQLKAREGLDLVVVDYLQLLGDRRERGSSRAEQVGQMTKRMKALARELDVPVLLLCQMNRGIEAREKKVPQLSDLRESGDIEADADVVAFVHRPEVYGSTDKHGIAEIHIAKQRHGPEGKVELVFEGRFTRFRDYLKPGGYVNGRDDRDD